MSNIKEAISFRYESQDGNTPAISRGRENLRLLPRKIRTLSSRQTSLTQYDSPSSTNRLVTERAYLPRPERSDKILKPKRRAYIPRRRRRRKSTFSFAKLNSLRTRGLVDLTQIISDEEDEKPNS